MCRRSLISHGRATTWRSAIGFLQVYDLSRVARLFPKSRFAILDARIEDVPKRPPNVEGTVFKTQEAAYLAGYLAAKMESKRPRPHVVSTVAGYAIPPVRAYVAGFQAGARRADPTIKTLNAYTNDFVNGTKCAHAAQAQLAQGSGVIFDVAGACGVEALKAAQRAGAWGIGVDIDQSYLGSFVLTSVIKRLDVAVYDFAVAVSKGTLPHRRQHGVRPAEQGRRARPLQSARAAGVAARARPAGRRDRGGPDQGAVGPQAARVTAIHDVPPSTAIAETLLPTEASASTLPFDASIRWRPPSSLPNHTEPAPAATAVIALESRGNRIRRQRERVDLDEVRGAVDEPEAAVSEGGSDRDAAQLG